MTFHMCNECVRIFRSLVIKKILSVCLCACESDDGLRAYVCEHEHEPIVYWACHTIRCVCVCVYNEDGESVQHIDCDCVWMESSTTSVFVCARPLSFISRLLSFSHSLTNTRVDAIHDDVCANMFIHGGVSIRSSVGV